MCLVVATFRKSNREVELWCQIKPSHEARISLTGAQRCPEIERGDIIAAVRLIASDLFIKSTVKVGLDAKMPKEANSLAQQRARRLAGRLPPV